MSRRGFVRASGFAGVGVAAALVGCRSSGSGSGSEKQQPAAAGASASAQAAGLFAVAGAKRGGTITVDGSEPTTGWDPHATSAAFTSAVIEPLHLKLIRHDYRKGFVSGSDALVGELAEKWENPDPLTYVITLRKGLNWPDQEPMKGREITAEDVTETFAHAMLPTSQVQTYVYDNLDTVTAVDKSTVRIKLKQPNFFFPSDIDSVSSLILPKGYYEWAGKDAKDPSKARGGGPWVLVDYQPNSVIRYKPNEAYRKVFGVPYADNMNIAILAGGSPRLQAYLAKNLDVFNPLAGELEPAKKGRPDGKVREEAYVGGAGLSISIKSTQKPFDDVRVRRALSMAVDREGWGKTLQGPTKPEAGPISWAYPNWKLPPSEMPKEVQQWLKYDPAEARKLMDAAGIKSSTEYTLNYYPYDPTYQPQAQLIIDWASKAGMTLKGKVYDYNNWLATAFIGKYQDLLFGPDAGIDRVSSGLVDRLSKQGDKNNPKNHSDISDAETQKMLRDFWGAKDDATAKDIAKKVQARSVDQVFSIYQPQPASPTFWSPDLQNYDGQRSYNYQYNYRTAFFWRG